MRYVCMLAVLGCLIWLDCRVTAQPMLSPENQEETDKHERSETGQRDAVLNWLRDHQHEDGRWSADKFNEASIRKDAKSTGSIDFVKKPKAGNDLGDANPNADIEITSLALLTFTGNGYDHKTGKYKDVVLKAMKFLVGKQYADGSFSDSKKPLSIRADCVATRTMAEVYGLSGDRALKARVELAAKYILSQQNDDGGWGSEPDAKESNIAETYTAIFALGACKMSSIKLADINAKAKKAATFLDSLVDERSKQFQVRESVSEKAKRNDHLPEAQYFGAMMMLYHWLERDDLPYTDQELEGFRSEVLKKKNLPEWSKNDVDTELWWVLTGFIGNTPKDDWIDWVKELQSVLVNHQRGYCEADKDENRDLSRLLDEHGSWDPVGERVEDLGRAYATCVAANALTNAARGLRLHTIRQKK